MRDPDGVVHRVRVGNYLGQNYGRVLAISEDLNMHILRVIADAGTSLSPPAQALHIEQNALAD